MPATSGDRQTDELIDGFAELTLETVDLDSSERFYRDLIGLRVLSRDDDRIWLAVGASARLGLWIPGVKEFGDEGGRHVHFAFSAGRIEELAARLRDGGVAVRGPVEHEGGDRSIYFEDPAGNLVEAWNFFARGDIDELAS